MPAVNGWTNVHLAAGQSQPQHHDRLRGSSGNRNGIMVIVMLNDWLAAVKRHVEDPDESAVKGIIKYLGVVLRDRDGSYVACTHKSERERIRNSFLKKKLGLAMSDSDLDKAVIETCQRMKGVHDKPRVVFYYLLAEKYGKLSMFSQPAVAARREKAAIPALAAISLALMSLAPDRIT